MRGMKMAEQSAMAAIELAEAALGENLTWLTDKLDLGIRQKDPETLGRLEQLTAAFEALTKIVHGPKDADAKDAARYRWIRRKTGAHGTDGGAWAFSLPGRAEISIPRAEIESLGWSASEALDKAIDKAIDRRIRAGP